VTTQAPTDREIILDRIVDAPFVILSREGWGSSQHAWMLDPSGDGWRAKDLVSPNLVPTAIWSGAQ
jgi:hypothetical protein